MLRKFAAAAVLAGMSASLGSAGIVITEWMYQGGGGEFIEFTNVGNSPVDMTGWSYDDDSRIPGVTDLSDFGIVAPGESVLLVESTVDDFELFWSLSGVKIIGEFTNNLGRNDEINLYDDQDNLVDRLTYGDQNFPGSIRTQNASGIPASPAALGANDPYQWILAVDGDAFGSTTSLFGDVGSPGYYIPEPASIALLGLGLALIRRR